MHLLVDLFYLAACAVYLPVLGYQMVVQRKNRHGWAERFGYISLRPTERPRIWVHAVSLGEVNATIGIVEQLSTRFPDRQVVISTTTDTGYARACTLYGAERVFRFPLDFSRVVRRVLDRLHVELIVLMELEVWHNLVHQADRRGIPIAVANGRLTARSARRLARLGPFARSMFERLAWVGAQDDEIAARFTSLGVSQERVQVLGSLKWDTAAVGQSVDGADALAEALGLDRERPLWVCGSTGPGEEEVVLDAYRQLTNEGLRISLAIVPRKPERFDEVARLIVRKRFRPIRRTGRADGSGTPVDRDGSEVILGDTLGELRKFYSLATTVLIGRSQVPLGGSDPMAHAAWAKPILAGPHLENFAIAAAALADCGALRTIRTTDELAQRVKADCSDLAGARAAGAAARATVTCHQGATEATIRALAKLIDE